MNHNYLLQIYQFSSSSFVLAQKYQHWNDTLEQYLQIKKTLDNQKKNKLSTARTHWHIHNGLKKKEKKLL